MKRKPYVAIIREEKCARETKITYYGHKLSRSAMNILRHHINKIDGVAPTTTWLTSVGQTSATIYSIDLEEEEEWKKIDAKIVATLRSLIRKALKTRRIKENPNNFAWANYPDWVYYPGSALKEGEESPWITDLIS